YFLMKEISPQSVDSKLEARNQTWRQLLLTALTVKESEFAFQFLKGIFIEPHQTFRGNYALSTKRASGEVLRHLQKSVKTAQIKNALEEIIQLQIELDQIEKAGAEPTEVGRDIETTKTETGKGSEKQTGKFDEKKKRAGNNERR